LVDDAQVHRISEARPGKVLVERKDALVLDALRGSRHMSACDGRPSRIAAVAIHAGQTGFRVHVLDADVAA
jgi:hypothetical protein